MQANTTYLRATFRHNPKNYVSLYSQSNVVLLISPGQPYYEGEKLGAIIDLINRSYFKHCLVIIGDTNYRHTLSALYDEPMTTLYEIAEKIGSDWLTRNMHDLQRLKMPYQISRWVEWFNHPDYLKHREQVNLHYQTDIDFRKAYQTSALEFVERLKFQRPSSLNLELATSASLEYLKEECTIIMPLWAELGMNTIIYPTKMLDAMAKTYETMVIPKYGDHLIWLPVRYKRKHVENEALALSA